MAAMEAYGPGKCPRFDEVDEADALACDEHEDCKEVTWTEFITLLGELYKVSCDLTRYIDNINAGSWLNGLDEMRQLLTTDEMPWKDDCRYCWITEFLFDAAGMPWITSVYFLKKMDIYARAMKCFESEGIDVEKRERWIKKFCDRIVSE